MPFFRQWRKVKSILKVTKRKRPVSSVEELSAYDLTSPNIMMREHFDVLDEIHDRFANSFRNFVTNMLRMPIDAELTATETVKFGEFMEGIDNPTSLHTFRMEPLNRFGPFGHRTEACVLSDRLYVWRNRMQWKLNSSGILRSSSSG
jgi:flagellar motor switch protein FliM